MDDTIFKVLACVSRNIFSFESSFLGKFNQSQHFGMLSQSQVLIDLLGTLGDL